MLATYKYCALAATVALFICGCDQKHITATCTNKADVTSVDFGPSRVGTTSIGILNTHHFDPGYVIELIPPETGQALGTGSHIGTLKYDATKDFLPDDAPTTTSQVIATDFDLDVDVELKAFTAQIQAALKKNTQLTLTGGSRHSLAQPLDILYADSNKAVADRILQHPKRVYIVVTGIVNGSGLALQYQDNNSGKADVNIIKIPGTKFSASVSYNCSNMTTLTATGQSKAGLAFFYTTVQAVNGKADTVATADLTKYALANTLEAK
jgi:hypothetical protein